MDRHALGHDQTRTPPGASRIEGDLLVGDLSVAPKVVDGRNEGEAVLEWLPRDGNAFQDAQRAAGRRLPTRLRGEIIAHHRLALPSVPACNPLKSDNYNRGHRN